MRTPQDRYLPPDRDAFVAGEPPTGRVIVIAPTRAACETIELAFQLHLDTFLEQHHGARVRELATSGARFGIVAGTGTGKTLAVRPIAEAILKAPLKVGVVNREREATPETPSWNVVIVTTGIARRWFQDGDILARDTLVVDEIHQTSAELELCLALGKRVGCRFIWLSATVDPAFYSRYLESTAVIESSAFDPAKAAKVEVVNKEPREFLDEKFLQRVTRDRRGVGVFLPTRAGVEETAAFVEVRYPRLTVAHYHGGEPVRVIRPFLDEGVPRPFLLTMTAAGQSALNVKGLDTVVILDSRFANVVERGRNVLTRVHLGANEILQMAGRVHGRVAGGRVFILSDRRIEFSALKPEAPDFQLAGDSERVALTCASLGVRADELDLPVPLDRRAYREALALLDARGIVENGKLSTYGKSVEALPVERAWAELLVHGDDSLVPYLAVMSSVESLHRMTRDDRNLEGLVIAGSDHLTAYNLYAEAYARAGSVGEVYGLPRHVFDEEKLLRWAERRGALVKAIEDAALGMASVFRSLGLPLPASMPTASSGTLRAFQELVALVQPFDLVIDEETASGDPARVSKTSVAGSWGAIAGEIRYFSDRQGIPRAAVEGTQLPADVIRKHAVRSKPTIVFDTERRRPALVIEHRMTYAGFELERDTETLESLTPDVEREAKQAIADALAREALRHPAVKRNRTGVEEVREVYRRSGGTTPKLGQAELAALYEQMLAPARTIADVMRLALVIDIDAIVPAATRARYLALPASVDVRGADVPIQYDVEETPEGVVGVARLVLPERLARTMVEEELPTLDRPLRFAVMRGQRGAARGATLAALQEELDRPWSRDEIEREAGQRSGKRDAARRERSAKEAAGGLRGMRRGPGARPSGPRGKRRNRKRS